MSNRGLRDSMQNELSNAAYHLYVMKDNLLATKLPSEKTKHSIIIVN
jgi:hypothetical protein